MQLGRLRALAAAAAGTLIWAGSAHAATTDFATSFEATDPPPTWISTAERASGVTGPAPTGIPGNVTDTVVGVRASGENTGGGEVKENLVDGSPESKWLVFARTGWVELELAQPVAVVHYALTSANDAAGRDPRDWTLQGSQDGSTWTTLDTQAGQTFAERFETKEYRFANTIAYRHYRLDITRNNGDDLLQLAELQLSNGSTAPPPLGDMRTAPGAGPRGGYNAKSGAGFTGLKALEYGGEHTTAGRAYSYNKVYDVDVRVRRRTELSYLIYPNFIRDDLRYPSTYVAVDLAFTDGTRLSDLRVRDQHGARLSPQGQGTSKTLYTNQWNFKRARIGAVAAGKRIDRILVGYDNPEGPASFGGWIDDITITGRPPRQRRSRLSDWVITTRGTNSSGSFSRGNNIPATAVPHGFNFWTPVTNAGSLSWLYEYHKANNAENLPTLQAFSASHEPSPWMGDRQTFQVMPSAAAAAPPTGRSERALAFRHANEVARPHYYGVTFENGVMTEIAPTDHAAMFRFTFPGTTSSLIFDNVNDDAGLSIDRAAGVVTGWSDVRSGLSNGATRMFVYATFDKPITASEQTGDRTGYARFDARAVTMRIATSLISVEQAQHNLELEIGPRDTFERVRDRAQAQWDRKLRVIEVEGATEDQRTTLYSNLYRLFLYPNSAHENVGGAARPVWRHAVQSSTTTPPSTPERTGAPVVDGKVYVNNGFWDTYRTTWSAYSLFTPRMAGELVDGFVQQYRDGGWISRWSSPGYANLMTGTSSDVAFADAFVKGVRGFDARDAYEAAVKNATVAPPGDPFNPSVGRKGLVQSIFLGYTPSRVSEGVSWALEGYINDFGIANMAARLATQARTAAERRRYQEEAEYFRSRALNYVNMFDPAIRFFQGRAADGTWKSAPDEYDPRVWGHDHDYTETNGWNFAFHVPHDGQGLANLYGGRDRLAEKLDRFFSIPETAGFPGSYGGIIHEMVEARDVRMGQWGFSNQVSHHIPWMYGYVGQPYKTQEKVREVLRRLYVGSEIGQGYSVRQARPHRVQRGLRAVGDAELRQHVRHVRLDGLLRHPELERDALVGLPARDQAQDVALARRQLVGVGDRFDHARRDRGGERRLAGERRPDPAHQLRRLDVLEQEARGARAQRREDPLVVAEARQHDHPCARSRGPQRAQRAEPVGAGHDEVEQHDVGPELARRRDRGRPVRGFPDDLDVVLELEVGPQPLAHDGVIVGDQHPDHDAGTSRRTVVPAPGADSIVSVPPSAAARSSIDVRPSRRPRAAPAAGSNPRPSSLTLNTSRPSPSASRTTTRALPACRSAFCSASCAIRSTCPAAASLISPSPPGAPTSSSIACPDTRRSTSTCLRSTRSRPSSASDPGRSAKTTERSSSIAPRASTCTRSTSAAAAPGSRPTSAPADSAASTTPNSCWTTASWSSRASRLRSSAMLSSRLSSCSRAFSIAIAACAASSAISRSSASENTAASSLSVRYSAPMIPPRATIGTPRNERICGCAEGHQPRKRGSARISDVR